MTQQLASISRIRPISANPGLKSVLSAAKYYGILLGLLAVGFLGHRTHWSFGGSHHADELAAADIPADQPTESISSESWKVVFPSEKSLHRSGVKTSPLKQRPIHQRLKAMGVISYDERKTATLSARVSGTTWRVVKQVGDPVRRGDVLVIIDAAEVGKAKAEFFKELVAVETDTEILSMLEGITGAVSGRQVREARVALREARIRLKNAEQNLVNLGLSVRKEDFEKLSDVERANRLHFLGLPDSIANELDRATTTTNLLALTASFDGVVIRQDVALGEMIAEGKPAVEIADLCRMWIKLDVSKEDASKLAIGQRVRFTPDGVDQELVSEIVWISTEMNLQTRTLQIRAEVDNPIVASSDATGQNVRLLRANTFGTGLISVEESNSAYVIPVSALLHADDQPMVFVQTDDLIFKRVNVKLGIRERQSVQIISPDLKPEMQIVTQGCHVLKSEWILNHVASSSP